MFTEYKAVLKNLRDMQDQWWDNAMAGFSGTAFPPGVDEWQQQTLENVNSLVAQAVRQSLDLQREWLDQWTERAGDKKLKPKLFSQLSAEARGSTQRWLDNQNQLWRQWLQFMQASTGPNSELNLEQWESALQEYFQHQTDLLEDWSEMADFKKLSVDEATKLSSQIAKAMEKSIETQQRFWDHWLGELGAPAAESAPGKSTSNKAEKKVATKAGTSGPADDDLKQISGIGPGLEQKLKENGITTLRQIAEWSDEDIARVEDKIIRFAGRIRREKWVEQARDLIR